MRQTARAIPATSIKHPPPTSIAGQRLRPHFDRTSKATSIGRSNGLPPRSTQIEHNFSAHPPTWTTSTSNLNPEATTSIRASNIQNTSTTHLNHQGVTRIRRSESEAQPTTQAKQAATQSQQTDPAPIGKDSEAIPARAHPDRDRNPCRTSQLPAMPDQPKHRRP